MKSCGTTKIRMYPGGNAGGAAATCLIAALETSKSVTRDRSTMPRHGGRDARYFDAFAYKSNRTAAVMGPSRVPRRMLFLASKCTITFTVNLGTTFYQRLQTCLSQTCTC